MIPTPADVAASLAKRIRAERKRRRWTQSELAVRSGLSVATVARLESTGQGQLSSLIGVVAALGRLRDFDALLVEQGPATLAELRRRG